MEIKNFVINLKRRPDRLENFKAKCPLEFTVVPAFDGKNAQNESEAEKNLIKKFEYLRPGEIGCFISHIRIFQKIVNDAIPLALIMEDDAIFCEDFLNEYDKVIREIPENTDILYIGGRFYPGFQMSTGERISERIVKHLHLNNPHDSDRTAHAYIVSQRLAKFILDIFNMVNIIQLPLDHWILRVSILNDIKIYNAFPLLCYSPLVGDSDIR
jgi:glycosyl transferase family 25